MGPLIHSSVGYPLALTMALAWAQKQEQEGNAATLALLSSISAAPYSAGKPTAAATTGGLGCSASSSSRARIPENYIVVFTQVLPDGLGDLIFGENAILELRDVAAGVVWVRCYSGDNAVAGEQLISETANKMCCMSVVCTTKDTLAEELRRSNLEAVWAGARERFLAPWIFGLSVHEEALLRLAHDKQTKFWALTEYGRGMGNIHTYTGGFGSMICTGWVVGKQPGGVFRTIRRAPHTPTDWSQIMAKHCQIADPSAIRLWWFYSRGDDEKKHDIEFFNDNDEGVSAAFLACKAESQDSDVTSATPHIRNASKVIPVTTDGSIMVGYEKTSGEKLAEQLVE